MEQRPPDSQRPLVKYVEKKTIFCGQGIVFFCRVYVFSSDGQITNQITSTNHKSFAKMI